VAANLSCVPTVKPGKVDVHYMAVSVVNLTLQMEKMSACLAALKTGKSSGSPMSQPLFLKQDTPSASLPMQSQKQQLDDADQIVQKSVTMVSWGGRKKSLSNFVSLCAFHQDLSWA